MNPEVINRVRKAWGLTIRDGFGQTESSVMIANTPGQVIVPGAVGRPLPGVRTMICCSRIFCPSSPVRA